MKSETKPTRIVLVDDHPMVRERLAEVIHEQADLAVCGEADSRLQALEVIAANQPDLAIIDLNLKGSHGLDLIKDLHIQHPHLRILVLSMHDGTMHAERVIRAGAHGYITKQEATGKILLAIRSVLRGEVYLSAAMAAEIASVVLGRKKSLTGGVETLSDRELRVFELIGQGFPLNEIAAQLNLDIKTIETYRARIREKLHLKNAAEVLQFAIRWHHSRPV